MRLVVLLLISLALLSGLVLEGTGTALAAPAPSPAPAAPPDAERLERHLRSYLSARKTTASGRVRDLQTGEEYGYRSGSHYDSASVVKVAIMAAVLRRQEAQRRFLTRREDRLLTAMIRDSDNAAAFSLYASLGLGRAMRRL